MRRSMMLGFLAITSFGGTATAHDASATFLTTLFMNVCIPNANQPDHVRAWAMQQRLTEVHAPAALAVFVGAGDRGSAWAVPAAFGSFALSIRGTTQACAVYARSADPAEVESDFRKILEGVARPGLVVKTVKDAQASGPTGIIHTLIYGVSAVGNEAHGFLYTLQTTERSGGAFQATLQAARYDGGS